MQVFRISVKDWRAFVGTPSQPGEQALPASVRRRVTPTGRRALAAAWPLAAGQPARFIFSSRHGEYSRTFSMLQMLAREDAVSPADFSMSVHNALAGLLSIATGNRQGHTALAAGRDTFGYGLIEAAACLAEKPDDNVLLVHHDEPLPEAYDKVADDVDRAIVVALLLQAPQGVGDLEVEAIHKEIAIPEQPGDLAAAFVAFLHSHDSEGTACGERLNWRWCRV